MYFIVCIFTVIHLNVPTVYYWNSEFLTWFENCNLNKFSISMWNNFLFLSYSHTYCFGNCYHLPAFTWNGHSQINQGKGFKICQQFSQCNTHCIGLAAIHSLCRHSVADTLPLMTHCYSVLCKDGQAKSKQVLLVYPAVTGWNHQQNQVSESITPVWVLTLRQSCVLMNWEHAIPVDVTNLADVLCCTT